MSLGAADFAAKRKATTEGERQRPAPARGTAGEPALEGAISLSSNVYPAEHRFEMWREFFARNILHVEAATPDKSAFAATTRVQRLPAGVTLWNGYRTPCSQLRTKALLSDGYDGMFFNVCVGGKGHWQFGDRSITLKPSQAGLVPTSMLGGFHTDSNYRGLGVGLDREIARQFARSPEDLLLRPVNHGSGAVALLVAYCRHLLRRSGAPAPGLGLLASRQIRELVAYALAPQSELARAAPFAGVKAARLRAVRDDIAAHLGDGNLSVGAVAARQRVTPRYVQMLFEEDGTTFSQYVLGERLASAHRRLRDLSSSRLTITAIAFAAGFGDLSHFNRAFRCAYGMTPSDVRETARKHGG